MKNLFYFLILTLLLLPIVNIGFAESIYDINIPSGSADKNAPFHWQSEKDGDTSGYIEIIIGDVIQWKNGDTVAHTITSGSFENGPDGIFDSGNLGPGGLFVQKFNEIGKFPYYCTIHPWRTGIVNVVSGNSILPKVASDVGDGMTTFDIEYKFNRILNTAKVDENSKSILFELKGRTMNDDHTLTLWLPSELITGISSVSIDGNDKGDFDQVFENGFTILKISEIPPFANSISISGSTIIPEFSELTLVILIISISMIVFLSRKQMLEIIKIR